MPPTIMPEPFAPTLTTHLFPELGRELVALLRSLEAGDWDRRTVCPAWTVKDIASHLLDTALRRLATGRDGHLPLPDAPIESYDDLVRLLNGLNADWVRATRRLSPRLLTDLLEWVEPALVAHLASLDLDGPALFPVSWAGEDLSACWFDVARELTERWLHQQQIRLAVGAPPLDRPELSQTIFDTFLRALPHRYRHAEAKDGTTLSITIRGVRDYEYTLARDRDAWRLLRGSPSGPTAEISLAEQPAWLLLTKGLEGTSAREEATLAGVPRLCEPFFDVLAVMA